MFTGQSDPDEVISKVRITARLYSEVILKKKIITSFGQLPV